LECSHEYGGLFMSGEFLPIQILSRRNDEISALIPVPLWIVATLLSVGVVVAELFLAYAWLVVRADEGRLRGVLAFVVAAALHGGIEIVGQLSIGLFSFYMIVLHLLLFTASSA